MWTERQLADNLQELGLPRGAVVLVHASLRSIGPIEGGGETLLRALLEVVGPEGTILAPTFSWCATDPAEHGHPQAEPEAIEDARAKAVMFDRDATPADIPSVGIFPEIVRRHPHAIRGDHPSLSFAAVGPDAAFLTHNVPFHYPLGTHSSLDRLHQRNGWVLLIGVGQTVNSSLHLAEVWADAPYIHRKARLLTAPGEWTAMDGSPECSAGFAKIEPVLRQARLLHRGTVGNAPSQLMRQREVVSMAVAMLRGKPGSLLCDDPACRWCRLARKFTTEAVSVPTSFCED